MCRKICETQIFYDKRNKTAAIFQNLVSPREKRKKKKKNVIRDRTRQISTKENV